MKADASVPVDTPDIRSPFGMLRFAEDYRLAANAVRAASKQKVLLSPSYNLLGQSIELSLKAYLLARGMTDEELKRRPYGHDLEALLDEALRRRIDRFVQFQQFHLDAIKLISPIYSRHEFRYIRTGKVTIPKWGFLAHAAAELTRCQHDWLLRRRCGKEAATRRIALRGQF